MGMAPGMVQSLFQALHARSFPEEASQPVNALNPVNAFKFNCSTEFGSKDLKKKSKASYCNTQTSSMLFITAYETNDHILRAM